MSSETSNIYHLGEYTLEAETKRLTRHGEVVHLPNRPFQVLLHLRKNHDRLVSRSELFEEFWDGRDVYDDALRKAIGTIRKTLDDHHDKPKFIETRWAGGYRYIGPIVASNGNGSHTVSSDPLHVPDENASQEEVGVAAAKTRTNSIFLLSIGALALIVAAILGYRFFVRSDAQDRVSAAPSAPVRRSIAILPIKNLTGDTANDYLSDGITESLINQVSLVDTLTVISRGSAFQFKDKDVSAQEIAGRLGVDSILEGGLRQNGDNLRVEVRLVDAKDGRVMWTNDSEQKKIADVFTIEDGIACQIITELRVKICGEIPPAARYTANVRAYQLYLKGLYYRNKFGRQNLLRAIDLYDQALEIDAKYALAHEGLAMVYLVMDGNSQEEHRKAAAAAEFHAARALELDDTLAGAYVVLGVVRTSDNYDLAARKAFYEQALSKNPNNQTVRLWLAANYVAEGKFEEAEKEALRVREIDPLSSGVHLTLAELYYYWNKPEKSLEQAEALIAVSPGETEYNLLAKAYAEEGDFEKAFAALDKTSPQNSVRALILGFAGRGSEARDLVEAYLASADAKKNPYWVGCLFAATGDKEKAFVWLETSYQTRQADLISLKVDPALRSLHDDPRYQEMLHRVGLAE